MSDFMFFDSASTTPCCSSAVKKMCEFSDEAYGNPSSSHALGQFAARGIHDARAFFADHFQIDPKQVLFTGSGTEADNLALYGICMNYLTQRLKKNEPIKGNLIISSIEHPGILKTAESLKDFGLELKIAPVDSQGMIIEDELLKLVDSETLLISIMHVNNIVGSIQNIEKLAKLAKSKNPNLVFHSDTIQAFGRVALPKAPSSVDLLSLSAHKIKGPKGVGALIVLNEDLIDKKKIRPLIWGGGQENGYRSGTQSAALICAFHCAAQDTINDFDANYKKVKELNRLFKDLLTEKKLLNENKDSLLQWNSSTDSVPHIVNLSIPGFPSGPFVKFLEERKCLISSGSACSSKKTAPEPVLTAMNLPHENIISSVRISFSTYNDETQIHALVEAISSSIDQMKKLLGK